MCLLLVRMCDNPEGYDEAIHTLTSTFVLHATHTHQRLFLKGKTCVHALAGWCCPLTDTDFFGGICVRCPWTL